MLISKYVVDQMSDRADAIRKIRVDKNAVIKPTIIKILSYIMCEINTRKADDVTMDDGRTIDDIPVPAEFDWAISPRSVRLISGDRVSEDMLDREGFVRIQPDEIRYVEAGDPEDPESYDSETTEEEAIMKERKPRVVRAGLVNLQRGITYKEYIDACDEFRRFFKSDISSGMVTVGSKRIDMSLADAIGRVTVSTIVSVVSEDGEELVGYTDVRMHVNGTDWYYPIRLKNEAYNFIRSLVKDSFWNTEADFNIEELMLSKLK